MGQDLNRQTLQVLSDLWGPAPSRDEALLARVKARVLQELRDAPAPASSTVRAGDADWQVVAPGVEQKILWVSGGSVSRLLRCVPGTRFPAHWHAADEECIVMEGSLRIGSLELHAGDFHAARQGTLHEDTVSDTGALVYLRGVPEPA